MRPTSTLSSHKLLSTCPAIYRRGGGCLQRLVPPSLLFAQPLRGAKVATAWSWSKIALIECWPALYYPFFKSIPLRGKLFNRKISFLILCIFSNLFLFFFFFFFLYIRSRCRWRKGNRCCVWQSRLCGRYCRVVSSGLSPLCPSDPPFWQVVLIIAVLFVSLHLGPLYLFVCTWEPKDSALTCLHSLGHLQVAWRRWSAFMPSCPTARLLLKVSTRVRAKHQLFNLFFSSLSFNWFFSSFFRFSLLSLSCLQININIYI